jgi:hypothetical protein
VEGTRRFVQYEQSRLVREGLKAAAKTIDLYGRKGATLQVSDRHTLSCLSPLGSNSHLLGRDGKRGRH